MGITRWIEPYKTAQVDGPTLTAAAAATCLPGQAKFTLPADFFSDIGRTIQIRAAGKISCAVTTPGTARFDIRFISTAGTIVVADSLAMPLNVVAKTNEPWALEWLLTARSVGSGTSATLEQWGRFTSQALIGGQGNAVAGAGSFILPYNTAPGVGNGFDATIAQQVDMFFTQTVGTGSLTLTSYLLYG